MIQDLLASPEVANIALHEFVQYGASGGALAWLAQRHRRGQKRDQAEEHRRAEQEKSHAIKDALQEQRIGVLEKAVDEVARDRKESTDRLYGEVRSLREDLTSGLTQMRGEIHDVARDVARLAKNGSH